MATTTATHINNNLTHNLQHATKLTSKHPNSQNFLSFQPKNKTQFNLSSSNVKKSLTFCKSTVTTEKPSTVPEIVLQPIKEISGTVNLPGSKSLSNRILLLAALSE
ncbi:5-enol-pyruvylshikimate-phosphate synthase, partial [Tanacetum coccineum]